jgi:hypothetical protein
MGLEEEGNYIGVHNRGRRAIHQRALGLERSLRSAWISATNSSEDYARRKPHLIASRFHFVCSLWHLDSHFTVAGVAVLINRSSGQRRATKDRRFGRL